MVHRVLLCVCAWELCWLSFQLVAIIFGGGRPLDEDKLVVPSGPSPCDEAYQLPGAGRCPLGCVR